MRILICDDTFPSMIDTIRTLLPHDQVRVCRQTEVPREAPWAEVLIPAMARITGDIIRSCTDLRLIQQFGVGLEGVDLAAARERGLVVANVPGGEAPVHAECTAEGGVFLMMACARRYNLCRKTLREGGWGRPQGEALIGRSALIIGLGAVGKALAARLVPMKMNVLALDVNPQPGVPERLGLELLAHPNRLNELLPLADFVISTVTLTAETRGMLNIAVFERMKPTAFVINISRGPIVNEDDLILALDRGLIAGAGLDVLNEEPPGPYHPLVRHEKVVLTPHTAGVTDQSFTALGRAVAENVERLRRGEAVRNAARP
jgi:phosphoglycerate dehydrogenase-like enzyme